MSDTADMGAPGRRIAWEEVPGRVRSAIEAGLGAAVVDARTQEGGFSPGAAARVRLANGRTAFVKAISTKLHRASFGLYRMEAGVMSHLPAGLPVPRLLDVYDDGEWIALAFEDVDGRHPTAPWRSDELLRVIAAMEDLSAALCPTPWPDAPDLTEMQGNRGFLRTWSELAAAPPPELDPWLRSRLERMAEDGTDLADLVRGNALLHTDIRSDNLLLTPAGRVVFVDWAWACRGAPWNDLVMFAMRVNVDGGADVERIIRSNRLTRDVAESTIDAVLLALSSVYWRGSQGSKGPSSEYFRAYVEATLRWLRGRAGIEEY